MLAKHVAAKLGERAFCVVFEGDLGALLVKQRDRPGNTGERVALAREEYFAKNRNRMLGRIFDTSKLYLERGQARGSALVQG
jgi:hypothetical protein